MNPPRCPICHCIMTYYLDRLKYGGLYQVYRCPHCGWDTTNKITVYSDKTKAEDGT